MTRRRLRWRTVARLGVTLALAVLLGAMPLSEYAIAIGSARGQAPDQGDGGVGGDHGNTNGDDHGGSSGGGSARGQAPDQDGPSSGVGSARGQAPDQDGPSSGIGSARGRAPDQDGPSSGVGSARGQAPDQPETEPPLSNGPDNNKRRGWPSAFDLAAKVVDKIGRFVGRPPAPIFVTRDQVERGDELFPPADRKPET